MMTDREMLELAAKAAGYDAKWIGEPFMVLGDGEYWWPLRDDTDAFRLAAKLGITVDWGTSPVSSYAALQERLEMTRRGIVKAAAKIGSKMK